MNAEPFTGDDPRWLLDDSRTPSAEALAEIAEVLSKSPNPGRSLPLGPFIAHLPDAPSVLKAWRTFDERVAQLSPYCSRRGTESVTQLLRYAQAAHGCLRRRLNETESAHDGATDAELRTRLGHLTAIQRVNRVTNSTLNVEQVLVQTVRAIRDVLQLDDCSIYLFDERLNRLTLRATTGLNPEAVGRVHLGLGEGVTGWAAQHGQPVALEDASNDPRFVHLPDVETEPLRSLLAVPIILFTANKLLGVLNLQTCQTRTYSQEEISFVETVCGQIAIAIDNARSYAQTDEQLRELVGQLTALQRAWASIASSLDLGQVLDRIARHAAELSRADKAAIFKVDAKTNDLFIISGHNLNQQFRTIRMKVGEGAVGRSVAQRTPIAVTDANDDPSLARVYPQMEAEGIRSVLCVPLVAREKVLGGISILTQERQEFSDEHIQFLSMFAHDAALAIENARLYEEAQRALETQAILMREMQHRVKNNLQTVASLLSLQKRRAESPEAASLLGLSAARVQSIAAVHELFSEADIGLATVGEISHRVLEIALKDLAPPDQRIDFAIESTPINLGSEQATVFALVLNELVSNAIVHGLAGLAAGTIRLTAREKDGVIEVAVWNDGRRVPTDFSLDTHAGLGLSIVRQLVTHELSGAFTIENDPDRGATARVSFPAKRGDFWTVWWKG